MEIVLNGQNRALDLAPEGATVESLVQALGMKADRVAVERNGEIARRADWAATPVRDGDRFEIVHFVGGGSGPAAR